MEILLLDYLLQQQIPISMLDISISGYVNEREERKQKGRKADRS